MPMMVNPRLAACDRGHRTQSRLYGAVVGHCGCNCALWIVWGVPCRTVEPFLIALPLRLFALAPCCNAIKKGSNAHCNRWMLIWIALICAAPVIAACLAYYVFKPASRAVNSGILIEPQRPVPPDLRLWEAKDGKIEEVPLSALRGKWLMLSADAGACAQDCVKKLYFMRQSRAAQGKERARVLTIWIRADHAPAPPVVQQAYRGTRFLIADASARALLVRWLPAQIDQTYADAIYLIDPKGHLMKRFSMELTPNRMQKDVARLLKWSGSG